MAKVIVITGAGGVLCGKFAVELGAKGNKIALLDLNLDAAEKNAAEIVNHGGIAKAYKANVLDKASLLEVKRQINADLGKCDVLINGAGGNNPRATTEKEYYEEGDETLEGVKTFFNLDPDGVNFVFNLTLWAR
jgi:Short-chain dehydrogenases of various substrate specificities